MLDSARLEGVVTPVSSTYSVVELVHQLNESKAKPLSTCISLLPKVLEAVIKISVLKKKI